MTVAQSQTQSTSARKPNDWRVLLAIFLLAGMVESQAFGHLNAFTPLFLQQLHVPRDQVSTWTGILSSLSFVIGLPLLPFWGVWADRYSRKLIIVRSAYVEGVLFTVAALAPNVWVLAVARLLGGFVFGNTGVMLAMLADATPRKRLGLAVGIASAGFPIGSSVGPFIGGLIAQGPGIRVLLGMDAGLSALMGLLLTLIVHEQPRVVEVTATVKHLLGAAVRAVLSTPAIARLFVIYFLAQFGLSLASPFLPIVLQRLYTGRLAELPSVIGATLTVAGIAMAVTTPIWGRAGDLVGRWRLLPLFLAAVGIGLFVEASAPSLRVLQGAVVFVGLFQSGIGPTILALLATLAPEEHRAPILTFSLLPSQLSWFLAPAAGAGLATLSLRLPFYAGVGVAIIGLVMTLVTGRFAGPASIASSLPLAEPDTEAMVNSKPVA